MAHINGHYPYAYIKDVLAMLPTHKASRVGELLPASLAVCKRLINDRVTGSGQHGIAARWFRSESCQMALA